MNLADADIAPREDIFGARVGRALKISVGQHSDKGRKDVNQDFHGVLIPQEALLTSKGVAVALADGIGSSTVSQIAAELAVSSFLHDYYCTSDAWSVRKSAERVLAATNSWLHSRTRASPYRYDQDRGYVCTVSVLVIKSHTAHVFHAGDTRVYRLHGHTLDQLTTDHRVSLSDGQSYLSRALGFNPQIELDYRAIHVERGDVFVLASDGVYEHVQDAFVAQTIHDNRDDLDAAARAIVAHAYECGSSDNLTVQIVAIEDLPRACADDVRQHVPTLAIRPLLDARSTIDGYTIVRELHATHRSHLYLAIDEATNAQVVLKTPSLDLQNDAAYLERFLLEEWIARRIDSPHVVKAYDKRGERRHLYVAMERVNGQTLTQWMVDHPTPDLETVRRIVEQIAKGLQAFHRLEMLHRDLRPDNVMIDETGTVKIIDFGAVRVAGLAELDSADERTEVLGALQYAAPEYFIGEAGTVRSDIFSLGVIAYQMLSGRLPYGARVPKAMTLSAQKKLRYDTVLNGEREIPAWIDRVLEKAVHPDPLKRYDTLSEFVYDLRHPKAAWMSNAAPAMLERNPVLFWKCVSGLLTIILVAMFVIRFSAH